MTADLRPIVFLHIPKTAGQTIHNEICKCVGEEKTSPIRVHTQVSSNASQMPAGYRYYSGHIDWREIDSLERPFSFTVLRDPKERIASFYFYLLREAQELSQAALARPENMGKRMVLHHSTQEYFFGADDGQWQNFILDHYDNFYCSYFASRLVRGRAEITALNPSEQVASAVRNIKQLSGIYSTKNLSPLEQDLGALLNTGLNIVGTYVNAGEMPQSELRWPKLVERMESDRAVSRLSRFTDQDYALLDAIGLTV